MNRSKILVTGSDLAKPATDILSEFDLVFAGKAPTENDLIYLCRKHQPVAIIVRYGKITRPIIDACTNLKVISKHGSGIDTIDVDAASQKNIEVRAAVGANANAVAEHAWALILACAKDITHLNNRMHNGYWDKSTHKTLELKGKTLGIIGLGSIGRRTAEIAAVFGMNVLAYDPYATEYPNNVTITDLDTIYEKSDVISLHCPLTKDNKELINREALSRFKPGAILVNTARGGLIDEEALIEKVSSGSIRSIGLDSFHSEPLEGNHKFSNIDKTILSPHIGGVTEDAYLNMGLGAANNVLAALKNKPSKQ
ncbi:hydroxyacid dehydrogenase [Zobellella denitrificans]